MRVRERPAQLHVVEKKDGKTGRGRALRSRASSRRRRRGRPVLQEPVLATVDGERRNRLGVRGVLLEIPEAFLSTTATIRCSPHLRSPTGVAASLRSTRS